jgi:hypothetical protein
MLGVTYHLISYYTVDDVINNQVRPPSQHDNFRFIQPRPELAMRPSCKSLASDMVEYEGAGVDRAAGSQSGVFQQRHFTRQSHCFTADSPATSGSCFIGASAMIWDI